MRVAAIDCGTNSIRLLIADVEPGDKAPREIDRRMKIVRLGQGVDKTGRIAPESLKRTFEAAERYAEACREKGVEKIRFVATSASRDAENRNEFVDGIKQRLGVEPEVLTGDAEAHLSFAGAVSAVADYPSPYLVVDLGGGSTEFVLGTEAPNEAFSMNVGCVRMTERHLAPAGDGDAEADPEKFQQAITAAEDDVDRALDEVAEHVDFSRVRTMVGLAGTVTTITAHILGLDSYDREAIHGTALASDDIISAAHDLLHLTREQRAELPYMHPGRVDVMGGGALVWAKVVERVRRDVEAEGASLAPIVTSEHDILDGIALSLVQ